MKVDIKKSTRDDKRYMATFTDSNGNKSTISDAIKAYKKKFNLK